MTARQALLFLLGLAGFVALLLYVGTGAILNAASMVGIGGLAAIVAIHIPLIALLGLAWWSVGRRASPVGPMAYIAARWVRDGVGEVLPFTQIGGFAAGIAALRLSGVAAVEAISGQFVDLIAEFVAKAPYAVIGLLALAQISRSDAAFRPVMLIVGAIAVIAFLLWAMRRRIWRAAEPAIGRLAAMSGQTTKEDVREGLQLNFGAGFALPCLALHIVCWLAGAIETWAIFFLMGHPVSPLAALVIDSLVTTLRTGGFWIPASLGIQEGSYLLVCALIGIGPAEAMAVSLIRRARDIGIALTSVAWTGYWRRARSPVSFKG